MTIRTYRGRSLVTWLAFACVVALVVTAGLWLVFRAATGTTLSAYFGKTVGLYAGSSVRVLGVPVGQVTGVTPQGDAVRVDMQVDDGVQLPADVGAVVVAPSLVSDRYVQLTPAYDSGPTLATGTVLAAGPHGDARWSWTTLREPGQAVHGARARTVPTRTARCPASWTPPPPTVEGQRRFAELDGRAARRPRQDPRRLEGRPVLDRAEPQLVHRRPWPRATSSSTSSTAASPTSASSSPTDSSDVGAALQSLGGALGDVQQFVNDNKTALESNVDKLASLSKVLVDQRAALAEVLDIAPTGATNFINSYDAASGTIAVRDNLNELTNPPILTVCRLISAGTPKQVPDTLGNICKQLAPVLDGALKLPTIPQVLNSLQNGTLPPLPLPLVDVMEQLSGGAK